MSSLIDPYGRPLRPQGRSELSRPYATPTLTGVRQVWDATSIASGLTPEGLAGVLRRADEGDGHAYLTLAMEMERREAHYRSVLGTRKRAVTRMPVTVEAASDSPEDAKLADEVRRLIAAPGFRGMLAHALDGLGKGYAAIELRWDTARAPWVPRDRADAKTGERVRGYQWIDPRWFRYDRITGRELRLLDDANSIDGLPLPPYRYLIHEPELMSGSPLGAGLARVALVAYMAKSYTLKDWLAFAEVYGMPLRVGKYGQGASEEDIATLVAAVGNLGTDAAAVIPESMLIEFVEAAKTSSSDVFASLAAWADDQISKLVLGQTASAEGGAPGMGGQDAQTEVREDLRDADAEELADTLNRDLVGAYLALNHGAIDPEAAPRIQIAVPDEDDLPLLTDALARLIPLGLRVGAKPIRDKLGLPDPEPDEELLGAPVRGVEQGPVADGMRPPADGGSPALTGARPTAGRIPAAARPEPSSAARGSPAPENVVGAPPSARSGSAGKPAPTMPAPTAPALNRASPDPGDYAEAQSARLAAAAEPALAGWLDRVRAELDATLNRGGDLADFGGRLLSLYPELPDGELTALMGEALTAAELAGRYELEHEDA